jgi:hypothetical protein
MFTITVVGLPDPVPAPVRLRQGLKALLRSWRLKCVDLREGASAATTQEILVMRKRLGEIP